MLTRDEIMNAREFHYEPCTRIVGPRGGITENVVRYRRNGSTQTWKTRPTQFRIPVVHGRKHYGQITSDTGLHTENNCPLRSSCCSCGPSRNFRCFCSCHTKEN